MKLSELIKNLQNLQKDKGDIYVPSSAMKAVYMPLYAKNYKGEFELSYDYLKSLSSEGLLFEYLMRELKIEKTEQQAEKAFNKAYDSRHSSGAVEVYWEFCELLDLLEIQYKKDWE